MEAHEALIASLERAVAAAPDDAALRLHLAEVLLRAGRGTDAVTHAAAVLQQDPGADDARRLMARALGADEAEPGRPEGEKAAGFDWRAAEDDLAGELGAKFMTVSMADVLDMYVGNSEKNVHELFETARANAPVVLFLDEVDAIGHKRSRMHSDHMRSTVNQLLLELDNVATDNEGVFVLAATNHPWDVDAALRRPGRLDRTLLVLPPDYDARLAIWETHLRERPIAGIDIKKLAKATDGYTGADIAHLCESAAEIVLMEVAETGKVRMIGQADVEAALVELRPSVGPWFETARNVALFANADGTYDELASYLRKHRKL